MGCDKKCAFTGAVDGNGRRLMASMGNNSKFPKGTLHPMCDSCFSDLLEEAKIAVVFNNDRELIEKWKKTKEKTGLILEGSKK